MKAEYNISKTVGHDDWRGMRLTLDGKEGEQPKELMNRVADEVDSWFANRYNAPIVSAAPHQIPEITAEKPIPEDQRVEALIQDIMNETVLRLPNGTGGLLAWKLLVQSLNNQKLTATYDEMYQKLSK